MVNKNWFKISIICLVIVCLGILSWQLVAMVETTNNVKDYLKSGQTCPDFVDVNSLTMKDKCTGLVWMSRPLPIYKTSGIADTQPGYAWTYANTACENLIKIGGKSLLRLPTVEELLSLVKVRCTATNCAVNNDYFPADINKTFANGYFWSSNNYNEPASYATDNIGRDYKRSVNLLTGQVDSPVFGQDVHLNAWCILARQPEIIEQKFTVVTTQTIANGTQATGGTLRTVYNRKCVSDTICAEASEGAVGTTCDTNLGYCAQNDEISLTTPIAIGCDTNYHVEDNLCRQNPASENCGNSVIDGICSNTSYTTNQTCINASATWTGELCDDGFFYNGDPGQCNGTCSGCDTGFYIADNKCTPNCGNGTIQAPEVCDNGINNGLAGFCKADCTACAVGYYNVNNVCEPNCGNGTLDSTPYQELCDKGMTGQADKCNASCNGCLAGFYLDTTKDECAYNCGNSTIESPELCDDGTNNGNLDKCNTACTGCASGYHLEGTDCVSDVIVNQCTGANFENATLCLGSVTTGLLEDTSKTLVTTCSTDSITACQYTCDSGYVAFNDVCVVNNCGDGIINPGSPEICDDGDPATGGKNGTFGYCNSTCTGIQGFNTPFFYDNFELASSAWIQGYCPPGPNLGDINCSWSRAIHDFTGGGANYALISIGGDDSNSYPRDYWVQLDGMNEKVDVDILVMVDFPASDGLKDALLLARHSGTGTSESYYALLTNNGTLAHDPNILIRYKNGVPTVLIEGPSSCTSPTPPAVPVCTPNITGKNWLRLQVYNNVDNNNIVSVTVRSMWWPVGGNMPIAWEMTYSDTAPNWITSGGNVGLAGWKTNTLYFDNFQAYDYVP